MNIKTLILAASAALALPTTVVADPADKPVKAMPAPATDLERGEVLHRHHINVMEIDMGKLAAKQGTAKVKKYGAMLVAEHTKADKDVKALARSLAIELVDHPTADSADAAAHDKMMALMAQLKTLKGAAFDGAYLPAMVDGHTEEIARVEAALPQVTNAKVKALLEKTLPSLHKHADAAKALEPAPAAP